MPPGNLISSFITRRYGRRFSLILFPIIWLFALLYISISDDFWSLLLGCCLIGFGAGLHATVVSLYFSETCQPNLRGLFLGVIGSSVSIGIFLSHLFGVLFPWQWVFRICSIVVFLSFVTSFFALESPIWLILRGDLAQAKKNFFYLRCRTAQSEKEFAQLLERHTKNDRIIRQSLLADLLSKKFFRPFSILVLLFTVQQGSGLNVVIFYSVQMVQKISSNVNASMCTIIIDFVRILSSIAFCISLKFFNRRLVYFVSSSCTFLALVIIVLSIVYDFPPIVIIISLSCYIFSMTGMTMIPWLMNSEVGIVF